MNSDHETVRLPEPLSERVGQLREATGWKRAEVMRFLMLTGVAALNLELNGNASVATARESLVNAAKWHGSNTAARQLSLLPAEVKQPKPRKSKRKK